MWTRSAARNPSPQLWVNSRLEENRKSWMTILLGDVNSDIKHNGQMGVILAMVGNSSRRWNIFKILGPPGRGLGTRLITLSCKKIVITETTTDVNHVRPLRVGADVIETATEDRNAKQRMTMNKPTTLFSPKLVTKVAQWNVRTMYETGRCAQFAKKMQNYGIDVLAH